MYLPNFLPQEMDGFLLHTFQEKLLLYYCYYGSCLDTESSCIAQLKKGCLLVLSCPDFQNNRIETMLFKTPLGQLLKHIAN